ncbi:MAG: peptidyl-prolyl cis-trans isomerase [Gammaproteobacteria bacterium]|nr:peptidyl-prolyl cis-trans isomerase [Gammaproteobacteria bacterium]
MTIRMFRCCAAAAVALCLAACAKAPPPAPALPASHPPLEGPAATPGPPPQAVLARAGGITITVADADAALVAMPAADRLEAISSEAAVAEFVSSLVDQRLMAAAARRDGLAQGVPGEGGREQDRDLASRWLDAQLGRLLAVSAAGIAAYYGTHRSEFTEPARARVSRVVAPGEDAARRARAALDRGASLGEARSQAGPGAQADEFWLQDVPGAIPLEAATLHMAPGAVGDIGAVAGGFAVLRVEERRPARLRPLAEVREGIRSRLDDEARQAAADAARSRLREGVPVRLEPAALTSYAVWLGRGG